ncbi:MAG: hypothetical protein IPF54_05570 [Draconibacterium sp.]|nr:hypothetical protein [Draconibacterium sp.]
MEPLGKLIYKTQSSNLPTSLPVYFYGLPDGKVYLIYSRFYEVNFSKTDLEFVLAVHKEFTFDFENEKLYSAVLNDVIPPAFYKIVDKADSKIKILKVYRNLNSYSDAAAKLYKRALKKSRKAGKIIEL